MTSGPNTHSSVTGTCSYPFCSAAHDINDAQEQVIQKGLSLAFCGDVVFQVIECRDPGCRGKVVFRSDTVSPAIDMRGLLLVPNPSMLNNAKEQSQILGSWDNWHDYLKFQIVPAWDESKVSISEFIDAFDDDPSKLSLLPEQEYVDEFMDDPFIDSYIESPAALIPEPEILEFLEIPEPEAEPKIPDTSLFMSEGDFYACLKKEETTGTINLRRLLPNTLKNCNLLTCLSPYKIWEIFDSEATNANGTAPEDLWIRREIWKSILEEAEGKTFVDAVVEKLVSIGITPPDLSQIARLLDEQLFSKASPSRDQLWDIVFEKGFGENLDEFFKKVFRSIFYPLCTKFALANKRKELLNWPNEVEQGKALFVDAPMGLGKTYAIVEALASDPNLSAVIFMPTIKLCQEITENLKFKIRSQRKSDIRNLYDDKDQVKDDNGMPVFDDDGTFLYRFKRTYLDKEVYYADGINPKECPYFDEFVKRYKYGLFTKIDVCGDCEKFLSEMTGKIDCRFRQHHLLAPHSRIVVTTHQQYSNFSKQSSIRKWYKNGYYKKDEKGKIIIGDDGKPKEKEKGIKRNFFIVDEDLVISKCYLPISLNKEELTAFVGTVNNFISDPENLDGQPVPKAAIGIIYQILGQFETCGTSAIVPPIDPEFILPARIKNAWNNAFNQQVLSVPEILGEYEPTGNHLQIIEKAVRVGFVVQNYQGNFQKGGNNKRPRIKKAFFANPLTYDLSNLPPHVFFDGTMLDDKFLREKLKNVEFKRHKINVDPLWQIQVRQNIWTDLPKSQIPGDQHKVEQLLYDLINGLGNKFKFFIVTKKDIREAYLDQFMENTFPDLDYVINHFNNLRGENRAEDCNIGIMLGSYAPPDAVEIAMALDFIQEQLGSNRNIPTVCKNNLWTVGKTNYRRVYSDDFAIVSELADAYRLAEHRQALARTRYLFHDVDFYIISKDLVSDYDPFLPEPIDCQFRADLFKGRSQRPEDKENYDEVKEKVFEWLKTHDTVYANQIYDRYGIWRKMVGKKLKVMYDNGLLELEKGKKTTYRLPATDGN